MKVSRLRWGLSLAAALAACGAVSALGTETFGNAPLNDANYTDWPGIMPVVNHPSRVYQQWVNGNEHFFYSGDTAALNDTLQKFSGAKAKQLEVVLRPGPGEAQTFSADRKIPFRWRLNLIGGIARYLPTRDRGEEVWPSHPVLSIYVGEGIDLTKLLFPAGLKVSGLSAVKLRTRGGLRSTDKTVRGWTSGELAGLDPYDEASRDAIAGMLKDEDTWVRLNAAHALAHFGKKAATAVPMLREALATGDAPLKEAIGETIQKIEKAQSRDAQERSHKELLDQIDKFVAALSR